MGALDIILSICLGIGLSAAVGFRIFLPLLLLSVASYFDIISLNESWEWLGSLTSIITLSIAAIFEISAYYIPWIDNILDAIAIPLATLAGTGIMLATLGELDPIITWSLAIIAGGGTAAAIKGNTAAVRLTSTATTGGVANPVVATAETVTSSFMAVLAIFLAPLALALTIVMLILILKFYKKLRKNKHSTT